MKFIRTFRFFIPGFIVFFVSACGILGTKYPEMHGRVLHEIHDAPLPHVHIVPLWKGKQITDTNAKSVCYHVKYTLSDEKGFFEIPFWREPGEFRHLKDKAVHIYGYRKRYRTSELTNKIITPKNYNYYLARSRNTDDDSSDRKERLRYLQQLVGDTICDLKGESRYSLKPMYEAIVNEADSIAVTDDDRKAAQKLKSWLSFVTPQEDE